MSAAPPSLLRMAPGRALWSLAWPVIALGLLRSGYYLADAYWAGRMGDEAPSALSAIGGAAFATWILGCVGELASVGTHALVARAEGAGERERVGPLAVDGAAIAAALGVLLALFARPLSSLYFALLGFEGEGFARPLAMGRGFLEVLLWGGVVMNLHVLCGAVFRALGDTRTPMLLSAATLAFNALLDPVLMFGLGPLPRLGLAGAAWATVLANFLGVTGSVALLGARGVRLSRAMPRPKVAARIAWIGLPACLSGVGFCLVYVVLGDLLARFGPSAIAGLGLGHRVESPTYQISSGFSAAAATLVGQHLGAGDKQGAARSAHRAALWASAAMLPLMVAFVAFPRGLIGLWATDGETLSRGTSYLFWVGLVAVPMALEIVYDGAFSGAGDTVPAMLVVLALTAARIPLAFALSSSPSLGLTGVWLAIASTTAAKGALLGGAFVWRSRRFR